MRRVLAAAAGLVLLSPGVAQAVTDESTDHLRTLDIGFIRVGTEWKACHYSGGQTV